MKTLLQWEIVYRKGSGYGDSVALPRTLRTLAPALDAPSLPPEVGLLLPTNPGTKQLLRYALATDEDLAECALGLFLASPMLNFAIDGPRLAQAGLRWVTNLPSVEQHDDVFTRQLADVKLDHQLEFDHLTELASHGIKVAAVVSGSQATKAALKVAADMLIVLPKLTDYAAGFPSLRQRGAAVDEVYNTAERSKWRGPILCLASTAEAHSEVLWPDRVQGVVCRPNAVPTLPS